MLTQTQQLILEHAKIHFLRDGFKSASLRQIVKDAGFTLGAFYGYYDSKEDLFNALVDETAMGIVTILKKISDRMDSYPKEERMMRMSTIYLEELPDLVDYLYDHHDEVTLLFSKSEGTKYANYMNSIQGNSQHNTVSRIQDSANHLPIDPHAMKAIMNGYYSMVFGVILSGLEKNEVLNTLRDIQLFYQYGMLGMIQNKK